jgi:superfamily I DNA and/or RNA helicase
VAKAAAEAGQTVRLAQKVTAVEQGSSDDRITVMTGNDIVRKGLADGAIDVLGGTAWLWSSDKSTDIVDVLFIDEAGQMALANVLAMAGATRSIVLLGDPQQLDQPLQGSHPPGADRSALAHLLADDATMPADLGLFIEHTWRLHPAITEFTSEGFYDRRLESRAGLEQQALRGPQPIGGAGLRFMASQHSGNDSESPEEARQVAAMVRALVESGTTWINQHGEECPLGYGDVLLITPYNAQVGAIQRALPEAPRVGTVDKFQGQEAAISIYSMTTSSAGDAPRGMDFLYSRHRLNVATSRARCVSVVVAEPTLLRVRARTPEQMRLANALCRFVELAEGQTSNATAEPVHRAFHPR